MDKHVVAQQLRQRQYPPGLRARGVIDVVSDDDSIDSYLTCACCGEQQVTPLQLEAAIAQTHEAYHLLTIGDEHARAASRGHIQLPARAVPTRVTWRRKRK